MPQSYNLLTFDNPHPLDGQVFEAIAAGDIDHLRALFAAGARSNAVSPIEGHTLLTAAVQQSNRELIQFLLDHQIDVNGTGAHHETALMNAASQGNLELVTLLLEHGARVEAISDEGDTALCLAAGATHWVTILETEDALESQGITRQTDAGLEKLCPQDEVKVIAVVERLLEAGAQPNRQGCSATPLMEAARYGQLKLLRLLLQRGAKPEFPAKDGKTALEIAKLYNQQRALTLLAAHPKSQHGGDDAKQPKSARLNAA